MIDGLRSDFPPLKTRRRRPLYRRPVVLGAGLAGLAVAAFVLALTAGDSGSEVAVPPNSLAAIDPGSDRVVAQVPVGVSPGAVTSGPAGLWVANGDDQTVSRVDPAQKRVVRSLPLREVPTDLASAGGAVWVTGREPGEPEVAVRRIDPQFGTVGDATHLGNVVTGNGASIGAAGRRLWVAPQDGLLTRFDTTSGRRVQSVDPRTAPSGVAVGSDVVWFSAFDSDTVTRVDPNGVLTPIAVGHNPIGVAVGAGGVWVAERGDDAVVRIDPETNAVKTTIPVAPTPEGVLVGAGSVWVSHGDTGVVSRIDPETNRVVATIHTGGSTRGMAMADGHLWVAVGESAAPKAPNVPGTLRLAAQNDPRPLDPALAFNRFAWQLEGTTCAKLLNYADKPGGAGASPQPEVATSLPAVSDGGRTFTFTVRRGFRFSPPSNQPVTAETFKYSIERSLSPKMRGQAGSFLTDVVGAAPYTGGRARHISGIVARGDRLIIRLTAPAGDLPVRMALPFFCAVPIGTPIDPKGIDGIPMAGPYYYASSAPSIVLARNPNYHGGRPRRFARIQVTANLTAKQTAALVEQDRADYAIDGIDGLGPAAIARLRARYPSSTRGRRAPRVFANPLPTTSYVFMNFRRPLFANVRMRRAVNYALDRRGLARLGAPGFDTPQTPTDQYLPPGIPGFRDVHIYPSSPDVATARKLAGGRHRRAVLYSCPGSPCDEQAQVLKIALARIGVDLEVKTFSFNRLLERTGRPGEPFDLAFVTWFADSPDPNDFLDVLLRKGAGIEPPFRDPRYTSRLVAAAKLSGARRYLAYGKLDADLARNAAPWAAYANGVGYDFFSGRIGCQVYQVVYGMDLAALCLR